MKTERSVDLRTIPIMNGIGISKDKKVYDWKNSSDCTVKFTYKDIQDSFKIIKYIKTNQSLLINYDNKEFMITTSNMLSCKFGGLILKYSRNFRYSLNEEVVSNNRSLVITERFHKHYNDSFISKGYKYTCNKCGWTEGDISESLLIRGIGCSCCANRTIVPEINSIFKTDPWMIKYFQNPEDAKLYSKGSKASLLFKCPDCGKSFKELKSLVRLYSNRKILCSCQENYKTKEFKMDIGTNLKSERRDLIITNREYVKTASGQFCKYYHYTCLKCGWTNGFSIEADLLSRDSGCACCSSKVVVQGINDIPTTAPWMVKYFVGGYDEAKLYTRSSTKRLYLKCPDCGKIKSSLGSIINLYDSHSIGCSCGDGYSYPNKFVLSVINQLGINNIREYKPDWCIMMLRNINSYGRYDFYFEINNKKYIVEADGGFHYKDHYKNKHSLEYLILKDLEKDKLAGENDCSIIRIDCRKSDHEFIKNNILNSRLSEILDLSKIDWMKVEEDSLSNKVKQVCTYYKNNTSSTVSKISDLLNINRSSVLSYLKKGTTIGWCEYKAEIEEEKRRVLCIQNLGKPIVVLKDNMFIYYFMSKKECSRLSESILGTRISSSCIMPSLSKTSSKSKGFTFEYARTE